MKKTTHRVVETGQFISSSRVIVPLLICDIAYDGIPVIEGCAMVIGQDDLDGRFLAVVDRES